jgi:hypothetical protein
MIRKRQVVEPPATNFCGFVSSARPASFRQSWNGGAASVAAPTAAAPPPSRARPAAKAARREAVEVSMHADSPRPAIRASGRNP